MRNAWRSTRPSSWPSTFRWYSSTTLSWVRVPVLSVQRMSMEPKSWMEFKFLRMTFCLLMARAPFAREVVTIMGSISGVRPTATEMANSAACIQSPLVKPLTNSTTGTISSIKRMSTQETELTPFSKVVLEGLVFSSLAIRPSMVSLPTASTRAFALPLTTLLPKKARLAVSVKASRWGRASPSFSTASLSPVRADWLTNKSLAPRMRRSAGIMSPAERCTRSPTTSSSRGISAFWPSRSTQAVVWSIPSSLSATLPLRVSWTKRSPPESSTMVAMIRTVA